MDSFNKKPLPHVIVCVHGLGGSSEDFRVVTTSIGHLIQTEDPDSLIIIRSNANAGRKTHDGIDVCADRLVKEIHEIVSERVLKISDYVMPSLIDSLHNDDNNITDLKVDPDNEIDDSLPIQSCTPLESSIDPFDDNVSSQKSPPTTTTTTTPQPPFHLSFLCHSLGGLIARQAIFLAFEDSRYSSFSFPKLFRCGSFISLSSPHLGIRHPGSGKHVSQLHKDFFQGGSRFINSTFLGRTGKQLYLKDYSSTTTNKHHDCLLYRMCSSAHISSLSRFRFLTLIGATRHDHFVPFCSSTIRSHNPYTDSIVRSNPASCSLRHFSGFDVDSSWPVEVQKLYDNLFFRALNYTKCSSLASPSPPPFLLGCHRSTGKQQKSSVFHRDNLRQLRFLPFMMSQLQLLPWRRLNLHFEVPSLLFENNAHTLSMGSWFRGSKSQMESSARSALRILLATVFLDHHMLSALSSSTS